MPFQKGNPGGPGRPRISLNKPELLLPIIFQKSRINWAQDFALLYRMFRHTTKPNEKKDKAAYDKWVNDKLRFEMFLNLMPYLCTKINIKDLDASKFITEGDKEAMTKQTSDLIKALENSHGTAGNAPNPASATSSEKASVESRPASLPPTP